MPALPESWVTPSSAASRHALIQILKGGVFLLVPVRHLHTNVDQTNIDKVSVMCCNLFTDIIR